MREILLMIHPTTGALAILASIWVFVEALNASENNRVRLWWGSFLTMVLMIVTWFVAGYWYVFYYGADKARILAGPWPFAHNLGMETKEHLFFIPLVLSVLIFMAVSTNNLAQNKGARTLVLTIAALIALSSFAIEGAGAFISMGVRMSLLQ